MKKTILALLITALISCSKSEPFIAQSTEGRNPLMESSKKDSVLIYFSYGSTLIGEVGALKYNQTFFSRGKLYKEKIYLMDGRELPGWYAVSKDKNGDYQVFLFKDYKQQMY